MTSGRTLVLAMAVGAASACGTGPSGNVADGGLNNYYNGAPGRDAGALGDCILGHWLGPASPCADYRCFADAGQPECAQVDCKQQGYTIFHADGGVREGSFVSSPSRGTYSSLTSARSDSFAVGDGGITWRPSGAASFESYSCSDSTLVGSGYAVMTRASDALAQSLEAQSSDGGTWLGVSMPR